MTVKTDCFAYNEVHKDCNASSVMFCKKKECKLYRNRRDVNKNKIEADILKYSMNKNS